MDRRVLIAAAIVILGVIALASVLLPRQPGPQQPPTPPEQPPEQPPTQPPPEQPPPPQRPPEQPAGVTLYVITRHEQTIQDVTRRLFLSSSIARQYNIVNIVFLPVNAEQWPEYIKSAAAKGQGIDVAWGGGPTLFNLLDEQGLLEPIDESKVAEFRLILEELKKIPPTLAGAPTYRVGSDGKIRWIGASVSSFGFTVNREILARYNLPTPAKWADLGNPIYARTLPALQLSGIADPTMSTSNLRMFEIILQAYGWENGWKVLTLIAANAKIYSGSSDVRDAVIRGDLAVGTTIDFYGYTAQQQNPACLYIIPTGESIVNADPIAVLKGARHPREAAVFVAWVLNETGGQVVWLDPNINRLPINPRIFERPEGAKRPDLKKALEELYSASGIPFNETLSTLWVTAVMYYFKATLVDAHDDLQPVWAQIAKAYLDGKITKAQFNTLVDALTAPITFTDPLTNAKTTFTLDYAVKISRHLSDPSIFQNLMNQWREGARARYLRAQELFKQMVKS